MGSVHQQHGARHCRRTSSSSQRIVSIWLPRAQPASAATQQVPHPQRWQKRTSTPRRQNSSATLCGTQMWLRWW